MRWQDLKKNRRLLEKIQKRAGAIRLIRQFFQQAGFLEMETPLLVKEPNLEDYLEAPETFLIDEKGRRFFSYLISSPEYGLKKMLAAGFEKIFQLGKVFRNNEKWGGSRNPEFTMLEWYRAGADYREIMRDCEELVLFLAGQLRLPKSEISYLGKKIDLSSPWPRMSMKKAWQKYARVNLDDFLSRKKMGMLAEQKGYSVPASDDFSDLFFKVFLSEIEPKIAAEKRPVFLYDYPAQMAALARLKKRDGRYAERFELYLGGLELANGYSELTDWREQKARFEKTRASRGQRGQKEYNIDADFISALRSGLPACAGVALGVDRLAMILTDAEDINEVIFLSAQDQFKN